MATRRATIRRTDRGRGRAAPAARRRAALVFVCTMFLTAAAFATNVVQSLDPRSRVAAARAAGERRDAGAVSALAAALDDADANVRFYAAWALGEIKEPAAAPRLIAALRDPEWPVRDQAAWALRELRDPSLAAPLAEMLKEPGADVPHIAWILRETAPDAASGRIAPMLESPDPALRERAVRAMAALGGSNALAAIRGALDRTADPAARALLASHLPPAPPPPAAAARWSFDDGDAKTARDVTDRGSDGDIRGCEVVEGRVGKALRFGPGRYVSLGKPPGFSMAGQEFTVAAWIRAEAPTGVIVARGGAACGFSLYLKEGAPRFGIRRSQEEPPVIAAGAEPVGRQWTHVAGVVRKDRVDLFVNGARAATAASPGLVPGNGGQGMEIGVDTGNSSCEVTDAFVGVIDEVAVYAGALSDGEIAALAHGSRP